MSISLPSKHNLNILKTKNTTIKKVTGESSSLPSIVIAGSGHSLLKIDYSRLPKEFHTFRVNNFYFEDKYYLGKHVDYYLCGVALLEQQFYNIQALKIRNEYTINSFFVHNHHNLFEEGKYKDSFPTVRVCNTFKNSIPEIYELIQFHEFYYKKSIMAGTIAILTAIGLGYKEIYLTGIDLYNTQSSSAYPFPLGETFIDIRFRNSQFKNKEEMYQLDTRAHDINIDKQILCHIKDKTHVQLYSLSDSPINTYIPLAPIMRDTSYIAEAKANTSLNDWLLLPFAPPIEKIVEKSQEKMVSSKKNSSFQWGLQSEIEQMNNNYIYKFIFMIIKYAYQTIKAPILLIRLFLKCIKYIAIKNP